MNKIHQKWNNEAMKIHMEASKIFSFGAFNVWSEISLRIANNIKKLANNKLELLKTEGKSIKYNKKNKIA
mgnify:CR=1 FL=1